MIDELAKQLYDGCSSVKPEWDQLGDVTRSVWRDRATAQAAISEHAGVTVKDSVERGAGRAVAKQGSTGAEADQFSLF